MRSKALRLDLKKAAPPTVTSRPSPRATRPSPRPSTADEPADPGDPGATVNGSYAVSIFEHRSGCRWITT
ncbi:MAG: hypothetical protein J2P53_16815, partial [Bradyrhizobiaceae bacterium]|nr:hypothetical protein [Bradyrhizobiaceae bacterium]